MTKFLDLRKKVQPQVEVIFKTIVQPQPWYLEFAKLLVSIMVVSLVVWGISRADQDPTANVITPDPIGIFGTVNALNSSTLFLTDSVGKIPFTVGLEHLQKVETNNYDPLILADIKPGDTIIAHGIQNGDNIDADSITVFPDIAPVDPSVITIPDATTSADPLASTTPDVASSTIASSTDKIPVDVSSSTSTTTATTVDVATTTPDMNTDTSTSTSDSSSTAASTP